MFDCKRCVLFSVGKTQEPSRLRFTASVYGFGLPLMR
jgi:hypothetical protein